ncbi:uncharacterized protein LOC133508840 [Syngnathoides biaculeatus]|uniref:uncharacterized protein LOC133508840 n=1 Tax=Syngnathoides biaculeatus TaxID=300417 RepID=UPI002ADDA032|nr:uncharacterized protein LOC133508840 [Syngnathoides biaculeatus]XP_061691294.1 uncharacterized protein LOC133508840 [Syngnathoides biaculeatus]
MPPHVAVQEVATSPQPLLVRVQEYRWRPARGCSTLPLRRRPVCGRPPFLLRRRRARPYVPVQEVVMVPPPSHVPVQEEVAMAMPPPFHVPVQEDRRRPVRGLLLTSLSRWRQELGSSVEPPRSWRDFGMAVMVMVAILALVLLSIILFAPDGSQPLHDLASLVTNPRLPPDQASVATNPWSSRNRRGRFSSGAVGLVPASPFGSSPRRWRCLHSRFLSVSRSTTGDRSAAAPRSCFVGDRSVVIPRSCSNGDGDAHTFPARRRWRRFLSRRTLVSMRRWRWRHRPLTFPSRWRW